MQSGSLVIFFLTDIGVRTTDLGLWPDFAVESLRPIRALFYFESTDQQEIQ